MSPGPVRAREIGLEKLLAIWIRQEVQRSGWKRIAAGEFTLRDPYIEAKAQALGFAGKGRQAGVAQNKAADDHGRSEPPVDPTRQHKKANSRHRHYRNRGGDNWGRTLGREQYEWLRSTLAASRAKFTFIFIHHLVGGETREGRGGAEAAAFFEWGGRDLDGRDSFAQKRPGWAAPIHALLMQRGGGVVVFHGHDHLYAQQERDGIVYQLVPQPGHTRYDNTRSAEEYGYKSGVIAGASGILRVKVAPEESVVEYVRAYPTNAENSTRKTGAVTHRYTVAPAR
jgi:3',5'-cyclic AMP phosphodiesterase CpdA